MTEAIKRINEVRAAKTFGFLRNLEFLKVRPRLNVGLSKEMNEYHQRLKGKLK